MRTPICDLFGIDVPIVQTGMGWVAGARLVSATAGAGALGILASATMTLEQLERAVREVKSRTDRSFGVNLRADAEDAGQRVQLLIREQVRVASFALAPSERQIKTLKDAGVRVVPSIGARRHAEKVAAWGVDAVIVQGGEGGGHTGAVATTLLLPQVVDAVDLPVIAAGGFFDGRGLVAALAYCAAGVAMGTRFLLTRESTVPDAVKQYYLSRSVADTVVTNRIDGVPHRVLRTEFVDELEHTNAITSLPRAVRNAFAFKKLSGATWRGIVHEGRAMKKESDLRWSQVVLAANTPMLLRAGLVEGRLDAGVLSSGQAAGVIDDLPTVAELIARIMTEAEQTLKHLGELQ
ncbi:MAG TPA: nitronate monooxygenase [Acidimicrobiia bacterium]|nr:nitronate monooxygenase [Acidimicrobiia bacterium]